jgi:large subunit ribosomal protein L10
LAISRERKEELIAQYVEELRQSQGIILTEYRGLTMKQLERVRNTLRPLGGSAHVVKNRLLARAIQETGTPLPSEWLEGPVAVEFCHGDVPTIVKALLEVARDMEPLRVKGGVLGTAVLSADEVRALATLPSREVLLAQVLGTVHAPASRMAGVIASGIRQVLNVLQAYVDKLEEAGAKPAPEAAPAAA